MTDVDITGTRTIDAAGHVVAPGFIDLHVHGQDPFSQKVILRDGVTSPLELGLGACPVEDFYASKEGKSQANYGVIEVTMLRESSVRPAVRAGATPRVLKRYSKPQYTNGIRGRSA